MKKMVVPENGYAFKARVKKQGRDPAECKVFILGRRHLCSGPPFLPA